MIKYLTLKNFRSYEDTKIVFSKRVNAIVGEGMAGKTNIIRAIEMLRKLRPFNRWKSNFADEDAQTEITLRTTDNKEVKLIRGKETEYIVKDLEKDKTWKFRKLNRNVPNKVYNVLGIRAINVQRQLDPPYMVLSSPPNVTKEINQITNINMIDNWIRAVKDAIKSSDLILTDLLKEKAKILDTLEVVKDIHKIDPTISKLGRVERRKRNLEKKIYMIETTMANIIASERKTKRLKKALQAVGVVDKLKEIEERKENLESLKEDILNFIKASRNVGNLKNKFFDLTDKLIEGLKKSKKCPVCLSAIKQSTVKRMKDEFYSNI